MKKPLLFFFFTLALSDLVAQDRHEAWLRINISNWRAETGGWGIELHQRTQSNYLANDKNIFSSPLVTIIRPWLYWRIKSKWILSYSPLSYHGFTTLLNQQGDRDTYTELRTTFGIQRNFKLGTVINRNRAWYEFRFIDIGSDAFSFGTRLRTQNTFIIPLLALSKKNHLGYQLANEFFIAQRSSSIGFDHNRLFNALQWKKGKQEINLGYQWSLHKSGSSLYDRGQLFLNTNFEL